jgi:hypothetical protein
MEDMHDTTEDKGLSIEELGRRLKAGVEVTDRTYHFKKYEKVFLGTDAVAWLVKNGYAGDQKEALDIGNQMITEGVFQHCVKDHGFKNEKLFYRFLSDEKSRGKFVDLEGKASSWKGIVEKHENKILAEDML